MLFIKATVGDFCRWNRGDITAYIMKYADGSRVKKLQGKCRVIPHILINTPSQVSKCIPQQQMAKQIKTKQPKIKPQMIQATKVNKQQVKKMLLPDKKSIAKQKKNVKLMHKQKLRLVLKQDLLNCPICLETMLNPATTECGHSFCLTCIEEHFFCASIDQDIPSCPSCRNPLNYYDCQRSNQLKAMIDYYHANFGKEDDIARYEQRRQQFQQQEGRRNLKEQELEEGIKVDYFNLDYSKWQEGEIFQKNVNKQEIILVLKIRADPGCIFFHTDYQINAKSRLLARHEYFTKRYQESSDSWEEETIDNRQDSAEEDSSNDTDSDDSDSHSDQESDQQSQNILMRSAPNRIQPGIIGNNERRRSVNDRDQRLAWLDSIEHQDSSPNSDISIDY